MNRTAEPSRVCRDFDAALIRVKAIDAGTYRGNPDRPLAAFLGRLASVARGRIENAEQLHVLHSAIAYLMAEGPEPQYASLEDAFDSAIEDAMDSADPLQMALLALIRYRLQAHQHTYN